MKFQDSSFNGLKVTVGTKSVTHPLTHAPKAICPINFFKVGGIMSLVVRKLVFGVSDQVRHKLGCTVTEDGWRLEILYLGSRGIVLSM